MRDDDKYNTELDKELQELAVMDWPTFCKLLGNDSLTALKVCFLRRKGSSYGMMQMKLGVTVKKARYNSKGEHCSCDNKQKN